MTMLDDQSTAGGATPEQNEAAPTTAVAPGTNTIATPLDPILTLPGGGVFGPDGQQFDTVEVRELRGSDEEALSRVDVVKHPSRYVQTLVERGVVGFGNTEATPGLMASLLVGDRDAIILHIRRVSFGDLLPMSITCPFCTHEDDVSIELDKDIPIRTVKIEDRTFTVEGKAGEIVVQLATANVQDVVVDAVTMTAAEKNTLILERCIQSINGMPAGHASVLDLTTADRQEVLRRLGEGQPGPRYGEVKLACAVCGKESSIALTLADLFRL